MIEIHSQLLVDADMIPDTGRATHCLLALPYVLFVCLFISNVTAQDESATNSPLWNKDYRHVHKSQVVAMNQHQYETALSDARTILSENPQDGESLYFATLALAHLDRKDEAIAMLQQALAAGVPAVRFARSPADWNAALLRIPDIHQRLSISASRANLVHGPMLGNVTSGGVDVWVRTDRPAKVQIAVSQSPNSPDRLSNSVSTTEEADMTAVVHLTGLASDSRYYYWTFVDGQLVRPNSTPSQTYSGTFRTAPITGQATKLTFVFGGGAAYIPRNTYAWKTIQGQDADMMLLLGDNVYIDDPSNLPYQRYLYYRRQSQPYFRDMATSLPIASIWDDHDFGDNDCEGGPEIDSPAWKRPVWQVFRQNWVNPGYGGGDSQPGCWYSFPCGDIEFFMLDGRYYRTASPSDGSMPTMLGPVQKAWLKQVLIQSAAKIKVLCSPVPWIGGNADKWEGFAEERTELFRWLDQSRIEGVLLLSADRHRSDLLVTRRPGSYDLYEFMSSKLTNHHTHAEINQDQGALFSYNDKCSFGLVTVDTRADDPVIQYEIKTIDNESVFTFSLSASQLQFSHGPTNQR
ncbi:MAG: alkaline phosphatase D family protein [Planctomycetales bacterium]|nr:alkaline phosphatase D family protein [Planctomycetales bacterium]